MSELSTVAIKDGHRGHPHHLHAHLTSDPRVPPFITSNPDAERADRISRLAGLERLSAVRQSSSSSLPPGASANNPTGLNNFESAYMIPPGGVPGGALTKERSTVGSASATASVTGDGSMSGYTYDATDKMSQSHFDPAEQDQDQDMDDMDRSSVGAMSDENASLVGFGEGAGSTVSGPVSTAASQGSRATPTPYITPAAGRLGGSVGGAVQSASGRDARSLNGSEPETAGEGMRLE